MSLFFRRFALSRSFLLFVLLCFSLNMTVSAALLTTSQAIEHDLYQHSSNTVDLAMANYRFELEQQLVAFGVAPERVQSRLNSMSDSEIVTLSSEIADLPAGGEVLTVLALVFLVLLFTDIAGYTDIFPFVNKKSKHNSNSKNDGKLDDRRANQKRKEPLVIEN